MKILFIMPGSGNSFFCGNCLRDNRQAKALSKAGHDVAIMPLYLPTPSDIRSGPLFFPAPSFYVSQKYFGNAKLPEFLDRLLSSKAILGIAGKFSGTTNPKGLEALTLSMINGSGHSFAKQASRIAEWVKTEEKPDVIHISSSMLIGIAKYLKEQARIPIVCSLQDEEVWINAMEPHFAAKAWEGISQNLRHIDAFTLPSAFYREKVLKRFPNMPNPEVVSPGLELEEFAQTPPPQKFTLGFFNRACAENGLDILAEAFTMLKSQKAFESLELKIGGGSTGADAPFIRRVRRILKPHMGDVFWDEGYAPSAHADFYKSISVLCAPTKFEEAFGLYVAEASACSRPVIAPATGSFPESVGTPQTLYAPNTPAALAEKIGAIFSSKNMYSESSKKSRKIAERRFSAAKMAENLANLYAKL